jgi:putative two-component system response regulator
MRDPLTLPGTSTVPQVLVADDDKSVRMVIEATLQGAGCTVTTESTGYGALQRIRERPFDLVFLDLRMPVGGAAVVKEILDLRGDTDIVIITGDPDSEPARHAMDYGACRCLAKPVSPSQVLEVAAGLLSRQRPAVAGAPTLAPDRVLIADDDPGIRALLQAALTGEGYECAQAVDGRDALERLRSGSFSMLIADLRMPKMDGVELVRALRDDSPEAYPTGDLAVIILTGAADVDTAVETLKLGAWDYLRKPVGLADLFRGVQRALEIRRLRINHREYCHGLEALVDQRTAELMDTYEQTLYALGSALDSRDPETRDHAERVARYTGVIAVEMGVHGTALRDIRWGAVLHDVGKIGIPDAILFKPGPLDDAEWAVMRSHVDVGYRTLKNIPFLAGSLPVIRHHHERWDGGGYPDGLVGEAIPLGARIFKIADVFDALITSRPYKPPLSYEETTALIAAGVGSEFDPDVAAAFERVCAAFPFLAPAVSRGVRIE